MKAPAPAPRAKPRYALDMLVDRRLVTWLHANVLTSDQWPRLLTWYRQVCAERILDAQTPEAREACAAAFKAAQMFVQAVENMATTNKGLIDARTTRIPAHLPSGEPYNPDEGSKAQGAGKG